MPVLGSGHPQADIFLLKYVPVPSEIEEGVAFYGRAGGALMKSFKRLGVDPLAVYGTVFVKCPVGDTDAVGARVPRARARGARDRAAAHRRGDGRGGARGAERPRRAARPRARRRRRARSSASRRPATRSTCPTSTARSTRRAPSASSGRRSARSASGTRTSLRTRAREPRVTLRCAWPDKAKVLVVANRTAESPELLDALHARAVRGPCEFTLLVPRPRTGWPGRRTCTPAGTRRRSSTATAFVEQLRGEGLDVADAKVGDADAAGRDLRTNATSTSTTS